MSEELANLPIVEELGEALTAALRRREAGRLRRPARRFAALAAAAALGAGAVLVSQLGGGSLSPAEASAAQLLQAAARVVAVQPSRFPRPGQFFFVRWRTSVLLPIRKNAAGPISLGAFYGPHALVTIDTWSAWSPTRAGQTRTRLRSVTFPTTAARVRWVRLGRPTLFGTLIPPQQPQRLVAIGERIPLGPDLSLTVRQLLTLQTSPRLLYRRVFATRPASAALGIAQYLNDYPIRPGLRAAIYRALALVPGIHGAGQARTLTGVLGVALGARDNGGSVEDELIIDPRSGALLGSRTVTVLPRSDGLPVGTVRSQTTIVERTITNSPRPPRRSG